MKKNIKNQIKGYGVIAITSMLPIINVFAEEDEVEQTLIKIIDWITGIGGVLATLFIVVAGIMLITQNENADNVKKAGQIIKWAAIGLVVILMAQVLSNIVQAWVVK